MTGQRGMIRIRRFSLVVLVVALAAASAGAGDTTAGYMMNYYSDVQGVSVFTHYVDLAGEAWRDALFALHYVHDRVIIPAIDAPPGTPEAIDAITSASRPIATEAQAYEDYIKQRNAIQGTAGYRDASLSYYVSKESDYFAQMVTVAYNRDFLRDNLNLAGGVSYSWDEIRPLDHFSSEGTVDHRDTLHGNLVATGILTSRTVLRAGVEINSVDGLQNDPYRNVYAGGTRVPERHPRARTRRDLFVRLGQYLGNRSSIKADARFYTDDWGIDSQTYGLRLHQYVTDAVVVRYRYRYYSQSGAYFERDLYDEVTGIDGYLTGDYRLRGFNAHLFGAQLAWRPRRAPLVGDAVRDPELILSYERYFNSNNFTANIFETGLRVSF